MIVGIDEAGRGPVIGPLVICALGVSEEDRVAFVKKDSKKLSPRRREAYAREIEKLGKACIVEVWPEEIDELRKTLSINTIEVQKMACAAASLGKAEKIYVDACDVDEVRFGEELRGYLAFECDIVSKHGADETYPVVAAASILAKVRRDAIVVGLQKEVGIDFGSGYPSDRKTREFLVQWRACHGGYPSFVRKSWSTVSKMDKEHSERI